MRDECYFCGIQYDNVTKYVDWACTEPRIFLWLWKYSMLYVCIFIMLFLNKVTGSVWHWILANNIIPDVLKTNSMWCSMQWWMFQTMCCIVTWPQYIHFNEWHWVISEIFFNSVLNVCTLSSKIELFKEIKNHGWHNAFGWLAKKQLERTKKSIFNNRNV